jgi:fibronectin-binding autotransporter adhesin
LQLPSIARSLQKKLLEKKMAISSIVRGVAESKYRSTRRSSAARNLLALATAATLAGLGVDRVQATNTISTFSGNGGTATTPITGDWNTAGNWSPSGIPTSASTTELDFNGSGGTAYTSTNDIGSTTFTLNEIQFGSSASVINTIAANTSANTLTFISNGSTTPSILQNNTGAFSIGNGIVLTNTVTFGGIGTGAINLTGNISSTGGLTFSNPNGLVTLSGTNSYSGTTSVTAGTVNISGGQSAYGILSVGGTSGAVLNISTPGTISITGNSSVGGTNNFSGAVNQTNGIVQYNGTNANYFFMGGPVSGTGTGNYGSYTLGTGATLTNASGAATGIEVGVNGGLGVFVQTGGTLAVNRSFFIGNGTGSSGIVTLTGGTGALNAGSSGSLTLGSSTTSYGGAFNLGTEAGGNATFTLASGTGGIILDANGSATNANFFGAVNLNAGTLIFNGTTGITRGISGTAGGTSLVNLNGATIVSTVTNAKLIDSTVNSASVQGAFVYNGGVTFNTASGTSATVGANLQGPIGGGLYATSGGAGFIEIPAGSGGSGYIGAPLVTVVDKTTGNTVTTVATANANISGGTITGLTLTSPGQGYTSGDILQFNFSGGGATTPVSNYSTGLLASDVAANGTGPVTKIGAGTLNLTGANTFAGPINISGGLINFANAGNLGVGNAINFNGGGLQYNGSSNTTDVSARSLTFLSGGATIDTQTNNVVFASPVGNSGSGGLTKLGSGSLTLNGSNTYTGATNVNVGSLFLGAGANLSSSAISVATGASLLVQTGTGITTIGSGAGSLTLNSGSNFNMTDGALSIFNVVNTVGGTGLTLNSSAGSATKLTFEIGQNGVGATLTDQLSVTGNAVLNGSNTIISIVPLLTATPLANGNYNLITTGGGLVPADFTLAAPFVTSNSITYLLSLANSNSSNEVLSISQQGATTAQAYWSGAINGNWNANASNATNWRTDGGSNIDTGAVPDGTTNVFFSVNSGGSNLGVTLATNSSANSITFTSASAGPVSINSAASTTDTLTINAVALNGNAAGNGITLQGGAPAATIGVNVALGAAQTWTNNSVNLFTVTGSISGAAPLTLTGSGPMNLSGPIITSSSVTLAGSGVVTLSGSNTFGGGLNASSGTVNLNSPTAPGSGTLTISGPIILDNTSGAPITLANNNSQTWASSFTFNGTGDLNTGSGTVTLGANVQTTLNAGNLTIGGLTDGNAGYGLTTVGAGNLNIPGPITGNTQLTLTGPGTVNLSGANSFAGATNIAGGTVNMTGSQSGLSNLAVGGTAGAVLNINTLTGTINIAGNSTVGGGSNLAGAVNQINGNVVYNPTGGNYFFIGGPTTGSVFGEYGSYTLSGGSLSNAAGAAIGIEVGNNGGLGVFTQTGGTFAENRYLFIGNGIGSYGVVTLTGGTGTLNNGITGGVEIANTSGVGGSFSIGTEAGGNATFNASGTAGLAVLSNANMHSTLNLNAGTLSFNTAGTSKGIYVNSTQTGGVQSVNLNGATIATTVSIPGLLDSSLNLPSQGVFVYNGGATFNTASGTTSTVSANLQGAAGGGLYKTTTFAAVPNGTPTTGYIGAPIVFVSTSGSGTGATAVANVDTTPGDPNFEQITGFTLTNPGQNYSTGDTLNFTLYGGTGGPASLGGATGYSYTVASGDVAANNLGVINKTGAGTLILNGSNTYQGGTNVSAGTLGLTGSNAFPVNTNLTIASGALVQATAHSNVSSPSVVQINTLNNAGTLDVTNNALVISNNSIGAVTAQVAAAYNNGAWNGNGPGGVITSSKAASDTTFLTAVGVATGLTTFEGLTVSSGSVLVKFTYYGDADLSGTVDGSDYSRIDNGNLLGLTGWGNGDFNYDGVINGSDYTLIDNAFNTQGANIASELASPTAQIAGTSAVPEPASLGLLGLSAIGMLGRRRRRQ